MHDGPNHAALILHNVWMIEEMVFEHHQPKRYSFQFCLQASFFGILCSMLTNFEILLENH